MDQIKREELQSLLEFHINSAKNYVDTKIAPNRTKSFEYYYGERPVPKKNAPDIVQKIVAQKVNALIPQLKDPFLSGRDIVKFIPYNQEDGRDARIASALVNKVLKTNNNMDKILHNVIFDGLLCKNGTIKCYWEKSEKIVTETFEGLTKDAVDILLASSKDLTLVDNTLEEVDPPFNLNAIMGMLPAGMLEQLYPAGPEELRKKATDWKKLKKAIPTIADQIENIRAQGVTYNGELERKSDTSSVKIVNVRPEDFLIDEDSTCIEEATFVGERRKVSLSELYKMDFKSDLLEEVEDAGAAKFSNDVGNVNTARNSFDSTDVYTSSITSDEAEQKYELYEIYLKTSIVKDKEYSSLYQIFYCNDVILDCTEVDEVPYYSWSPVMIAHKFYGMSLAEQLFSEQDAATATMRGMLQYLAFSTNPRYKAVQGTEYNLAAFQANLPGSVVPINKGDLIPFEFPRLDPGMFQTMQTISQSADDNTGVNKMSAGMSQDALQSNVSATAVSMSMGMSERRIKTYATNLANNCLLPCYKYVYELIRKNSEQPIILTIDGKDVRVNPKSLPIRDKLEIDYSLSRNDKLEHANVLLGLKARIAQDPQLQSYHSPQKCHNLETDIMADLGVYDIENYLDDVNTPNPAQAQAQAKQQALQDQAAQLQIEQLKLEQARIQLEQQKVQAEAQYKAGMLQLEMMKFDHQKNVDLDSYRLKREELTYKQQVAADQQQLAEQELEHDVLKSTAEIQIESEQNRPANIG